MDWPFGMIPNCLERAFVGFDKRLEYIVVLKLGEPGLLFQFRNVVGEVEMIQSTRNHFGYKLLKIMRCPVEVLKGWEGSVMT